MRQGATYIEQEQQTLRENLEAMAKTKTAATKTKRARTGTKTTAKRNAGRTARAGKATTFRQPKTAEGWARAINAWEKKNPGGIHVLTGMLVPTTPTRVAQVMPRRNAPEPAATH